MNITDLLTPEHTHCNVPGVSKKRVLEYLSGLLQSESEFSSLTEDAIYHKLLERERLGSTGIGSGVAIPHCRVEGCPKITGVLLKLSDSIDFDAIDGEPVDLIFALVVPEEENDQHLKALSAIAEIVQSEESRDLLRKAATDQSLYDCAISRKLQ